MWSEDLPSLTSPTSHYAPSAQTALVCGRTQKAAVHHGAYEGYCLNIIPHQRQLTSLGALLQHVLRTLPALSSQVNFPVLMFESLLRYTSSFLIQIEASLKKRAFDQNRFRGALLV